MTEKKKNVLNFKRDCYFFTCKNAVNQTSTWRPSHTCCDVYSAGSDVRRTMVTQSQLGELSLLLPSVLPVFQDRDAAILMLHPACYTHAHLHERGMAQ